MGGVDTRNRYHVHWGPAEQYAERREESALRRSGRPVPDASVRAVRAHRPRARWTRSWPRTDYRPAQRAAHHGGDPGRYGHLPVAALQHIATQTGAWYSELYGIATSYPHLRFETPGATWSRSAAAPSARCSAAAACWPPSGSTSARTSAASARRRGAPRGDRLPRRVRGARRASWWTAACCRGDRRRTRRPSPRRCARTVPQGRQRPDDGHPRRRPGLAVDPARARRARPTQPRTSRRPRPPAPGRPGGRPRGTLTPEQVSRLVATSGLRGRGGGGYPTGAKWRGLRRERGRAPVRRRQRLRGGPGRPGSTGRSWRPTRMRSWRASRSPPMRSGRTRRHHRGQRALRPRPSSGCARPSRAAEARATWATDAMGTGCRAAHRGAARCRARSCWARRPCCCVRSRTGAPSPTSGRPIPTRKGLWGEPTVVNNVETLAAVPWIVANGSGAYAAIGGTDEPGTTLVQLSGAVKQPGIVEVPMGTTLRDIIEGVGGGATGTLKAVLVGRPDRRLPAGRRAGHAPRPRASSTRRAPSWARAPSWSSTTPPASWTWPRCSPGISTTRRAARPSPAASGPAGSRSWAPGFCTGRARPTDAALVADLSDDIRDAALCGLERTAVNPLLSGMRYFAQEFEDHIVRGTCPAGVCQPIRVAAVAHR